MPLTWLPGEPTPLTPPTTCPVLLVLDPWMVGWPWTSLSRQTAATLQVIALAEHLDDPSVRATLVWAFAGQGVDTLVVCKEGGGPPSADVRVALTRLAHAAAAVAARAASPGDAPPQVNGLWYDTTARRLHLLGQDGQDRRLHEDAPAVEPLRALVATVQRELLGALRRSA
jgi:hypothetical protein